MKVLIVTIGSRGDLQPFISLSEELRARGYSIRICTMGDFREAVIERGFEFYPIPGDARKVMELLIGNDITPLKYFSNLEQMIMPIFDKFMLDLEEACLGVDLILYSTLGSIVYHLAELYKIRCFRCFFAPLDPTSEFPAMTAPILPLGRVYNRLTYFGGDLLWTHVTRRILNDWRVKSGLNRITSFNFPYRSLNGHAINTLYAFSSFLVPKPHDYKEHHFITGFWNKQIETTWQPSVELEEFLNAGSKPIYIGFGSTVNENSEKLIEIIIESILLTDQRAVVSSGWRNMGKKEMPSSIYMIDDVPHSWLFPRTCAVSHHGGAGTTAAGVLSGVPSIIVPFGGDQLFWGNRVHDLGLGTKPILASQLTVKNFSEAIMLATNNQRMSETAKVYSNKLQSENGVEKAANIIDEYIG